MRKTLAGTVGVLTVAMMTAGAIAATHEAPSEVLAINSGPTVTTP